MSSKNSQLFVLTETTLIAVLAMALFYVPDFAGWFISSSRAISLVPLALCRGAKYGVLTGLTWGLLYSIPDKVWYLASLQALTKYIVVFVPMSLADIFTVPFQNALAKDNKGRALFHATDGVTLTVSVRYLRHFAAGFIPWGSHVPKGMSPYWYSFIINRTAGLLILIFVILAPVIIIPTQGKLFLIKR